LEHRRHAIIALGLGPQDLLATQTDAWGLLMRTGSIAFVIAVVTAAAASAPSEARTYGYKHRYCGYGPYYDYTHSNALSPYSYIYPAANWGPFFQCHMYYSPVYALGPDPS
jgi:hypothetical protein